MSVSVWVGEYLHDYGIFKFDKMQPYRWAKRTSRTRHLTHNDFNFNLFFATPRSFAARPFIIQLIPRLSGLGPAKTCVAGQYTPLARVRFGVSESINIK